MSDEDKQKKNEEPAESEKPSPDAARHEGDGAAEAEDELTVEDILGEAGDDGQAADDTVSVLQTTLEERTRDLQRINAEFQNYRKRVERDKARAGEAGSAAVLASLLPILDDLDRAREHGDLTGPFGSVAEQLTGALAKQGLEGFGEKGDPFDPTIHEAVAHMQMGDVDGPTCIDVMRQGYRLGDRLLRPALVAVAEPAEEEPEPAAAQSQGDAEPAGAEQASEEPLVEPEPEGAVEPADGDEAAESAEEGSAEDEESAQASSEPEQGAEEPGSGPDESAKDDGGRKGS
nr:nucleotide exchange factor GrpE [Glycomyces xiaoerkulensis]